MRINSLLEWGRVRHPSARIGTVAACPERGIFCVEQRPVETTLYSLSDSAPAPERRDGERHLTLLRVGSITIESQRELCLIKNISAGGMLIRPYCRIDEGSAVSVELKCGEPISGRVRWVDGDSVGVAFDRKVDIVDLLATSETGPRPRMPRVQVSCMAWLREDGDVRRVFARDISQGGMKIASDHEIPSGAEVTVTLPGLSPQKGVVRWRDGGTYGVTFNKILPLPQLVGWLQGQRERLRQAG